MFDLVWCLQLLSLSTTTLETKETTWQEEWPLFKREIFVNYGISCDTWDFSTYIQTKFGFLLHVGNADALENFFHVITNITCGEYANMSF